MITDKLGNTLRVGDLVQVEGERGDLNYGKVVEVDQGGGPEIMSSVSSRMNVKPGKVIIQQDAITINCRPNFAIPVLTVIKDPKCTAAIAETNTAPSVGVDTNTTTTPSQEDAKSAGNNTKTGNA